MRFNLDVIVFIVLVRNSFYRDEFMLRFIEGHPVNKKILKEAVALYTNEHR